MMRALVLGAMPVGLVAGAFLARAWFRWREGRRYAAELPAGARTRSPLTRAQRRRRRKKARR